MPTFDIVSELNMHEVDNSVDQANKEITTRFDFKNIDARFEQDQGTIILKAPTEFQTQQMLDILIGKLSKRGVDVNCMQVDKPNTSLSGAQRRIVLRQGLETLLAKKIIKLIKDQKFKVQSSIQGDKIRVSGKKRDDLQSVIEFLKTADLDMPLQYNNFRD